MAAWRYSASTYTPRDRSSSRDSSATATSKYTLPSSLKSSYTPTERPSRWSASQISKDTPPPASRSNSIEEHGPVWAKTTLLSSPSSVVQRLKDRYSVPESPRTTTSSIAKRTETKELSLPLTKTYGRTTTGKLPTTEAKPESSIRSYREKSVEPKQTEPLSRSYDRSKISSSYKPENERPSSIYTRTDSEKTPFSSRASFRKKSPEVEKTSSYEYRTRKPDYSPLENKPKIYTSSSLGSSPATSRYLRSSGSSAGSTPNTPTTPNTDRNYILEKFERAQELEEKGEQTVTVVTRGTSPTEPSTSIYVRTRRADSTRTIEKTIQRPKIRPSTTDKECQTDDQVNSTSIYSTYSADRIKPRASYLGASSMSTYSPYSRYSVRNSNYPPVTMSRYDSDFRRSVSRELDLEKKSEDPSTTSETFKSTLKPVSPILSTSDNSSNRKSLLKSPPLSITVQTKEKSEVSPKSEEKKKPSLVINIETREKSKTPTQPNVRTRSRSKTQESDTSISVSGFTETSKSASKKESLKSAKTPPPATPPPPPPPVEDVSESESESESDETATTTTDSDTADEVEELTKSSEPCSVKRSITNFLQNIPNNLSNVDSFGSRSRLSLFRKNGSTAKIKFNHVESGERAWWLESNGDVPEGVAKLAASNKSLNHLAPSPLINRQYSKDKDWLKNSSDDGSDRSSISPLPPKPPSQLTPPQMLHKEGDSTLFLEVPKLPVIRQWSDEKPWWQNDSDHSSKENSLSVDKEGSKSFRNETDCDVRSLTNVCDSMPRISPTKIPGPKLSPERSKLVEEDGEDIDVTPALRRRRELHLSGIIDSNQVADYQIKDEEKATQDQKALRDECKLECSVRDLTQKLSAVTNGIPSPTEEKPVALEVGDMSGMISKAKAGLLKSQTKQLSRQNSEELPEPTKDIEKSEIEIYWKELVDSLDRPLKLGDLDFTDLSSEDEKDIFGSCRMNGGIPPLPPPAPFLPNGPSVPAPPTPMNPPPPLRASKIPTAPPAPTVKTKKTVKLFWKEVAEPMFSGKGDGCIWDDIQTVPVDGAKLEHLFESRAKDLLTKKQQDQNKTKAIIVLDNKRSNAINIGMTKLPPPRAIKAAILKMDSSVVTKEGIEKLLSMLPSEEERVRIQDAQAANPELPLGSAEQFLITLASISELEARLKLWAFKLEFENSEKEICEPLLDLKQGMSILRSSRTFRAILSTLLSIGNFLNGQDAKGFQIDYLSKVPEVKDTVNKHSLLHHLCVFVMEKFPDSTDLYSEIGSVTRASKTDFDELTASIKKLEEDCKCSWNHLKIIAKHEGQTAMKAKMSDFLADCAERIILIGIVHRRIMGRFHKFVMWLGVPMNRITTTRPHELFKTVAEFSLEYRTTRERILQQMKKANHHREKSRSRLNLTNDSQVKKLNSKEAKDDAKLRQLLDSEKSTSEAFNQSATWRRTKKKDPMVNQMNGDDSEILETFLKTAKNTPSNREIFKERRRSRMMERKQSRPSN